MLGSKKKVRSAAAAAAKYGDPLARDKRLWRRLAAAFGAAEAARQEVRKQTGLRGTARRLATDRDLRDRISEAVAELRAATKQAKRVKTRRRRRSMLFPTAIVSALAIGFPWLRKTVQSLLERRADGSVPTSFGEGSTPALATIDERIEVEVPVSVAYNQWTQFEEFPRFMEGIDEVRQLDDSLLHWAATVAGKHAEWDAKILEQQPDRLISWESTDGRYTRGRVSFEDAGPGRSRIRLHMSYMPTGPAEKAGSALGLDEQRIRGDLGRFRDLIEARQTETGAWRGEIRQGRSVD
jgi:hypothetical protein